MEPQSTNGPLFEVKMLLKDPDIVFEPAMTADADDTGSIMFIVVQIMKDIEAIPLMIPRISTKAQEKSYMVSVISA